MEVVVLAQAQWQEIAAPKTVQVSIFSCFALLGQMHLSYPFMRIYLHKKNAVSEIHFKI